MTRRHFIGALSAVTAAGGLGFGGNFFARRRLSVAEIRPVSVMPLQGAAVSLQGANGQIIQGVIGDVTTNCQPARYGAPGTEQISLLVALDSAEPEGGTYRVQTRDVDLGQLNLLPVGKLGSQRRLEAVITRIV